MGLKLFLGPLDNDLLPLRDVHGTRFVKKLGEGSGIITVVAFRKLNLVDLAGSECTQMHEVGAERAKEAREINKDLLEVSNVIR